MDPVFQTSREYLNRGIASRYHRLSKQAEEELAEFGIGVEYVPVRGSDWVLMRLYLLRPNGSLLLNPITHTPIPVPVE